MHDAKTLRRNFLWNTFGQVTYLGCQFLCGILVVRLAGMERSGYYNVALSLTSIFLSIASYGMYSFQVSDMQAKYAPSCYIRSRVYTCTAASVLCVLYTLWRAAASRSPYSIEQAVCILLFLAYRMLESGSDIYNAIDQSRERLDLVGKSYALRGAVSLGVFVAVLWFTHEMALTLFLMTAANLAVFLLYTRPGARAFYTPAPAARSRVLALLAECAPLAVYSVLATATASVPKLVLERQLGAEALGIYGPVTQPVLLLQVGATYLFNPFITVFAGAYAKRDKRGFFRAVLAVQGIVLALLPLGLLVAHFLGWWGLSTFVSPSLACYQYLLGPMVFSAVLTALMLFYSMVLTVMRCMKGLIFANVCGIAAAALLSGPCIRTWELQGTTYAAVAALLVQCVCLLTVMLVIARRHFAAGAQDDKPADPFDGLPD